VCRLSQGQVVEVAITDPRGQNRKARPAVVLTATDELASADEFIVAAISTKFNDPLPTDWILVPRSIDGRAKSGLTEPSVVKCHWLRKVTRKDIIYVRGWLPTTIMRDIMQIVSQP